VAEIVPVTRVLCESPPVIESRSEGRRPLRSSSRLRTGLGLACSATLVRCPMLCSGLIRTVVSLPLSTRKTLPAAGSRHRIPGPNVVARTKDRREIHPPGARGAYQDSPCGRRIAVVCGGGSALVCWASWEWIPASVGAAEEALAEILRVTDGEEGLGNWAGYPAAHGVKSGGVQSSLRRALYSSGGTRLVGRDRVSSRFVACTNSTRSKRGRRRDKARYP
jgi:hypothetical protein